MSLTTDTPYIEIYNIIISINMVINRANQQTR